VSGPGDRAAKVLSSGEPTFSKMRKAKGGIRKEWAWIPATPRGPRVRHVHNRLLSGSREISTMPCQQWCLAGHPKKATSRKLGQ